MQTSAALRDGTSTTLAIAVLLPTSVYIPRCARVRAPQQRTEQRETAQLQSGTALFLC